MRELRRRTFKDVVSGKEDMNLTGWVEKKHGRIGYRGFLSLVLLIWRANKLAKKTKSKILLDLGDVKFPMDWSR